MRWLDLDTSLRGDEAALIPAPGSHRFWYCGRPFWVWFSRKDETQGWTPRRLESLTFRTIGRDPKFLKQFVNEVIACHKRKIMLASYLYHYNDGWRYVQAYTPRVLDSVILRPGEKEHLVEDVRNFRASRERYRKLAFLPPRLPAVRAAWYRENVTSVSPGSKVRHVHLRGEPDRT